MAPEDTEIVVEVAAEFSWCSAGLADEQSLQAAIAAEKAAETASADLVKAAQAAAVKPAELSRTRGDYRRRDRRSRRRRNTGRGTACG